MPEVSDIYGTHVCGHDLRKQDETTIDARHDTVIVTINGADVVTAYQLHAGNRVARAPGGAYAVSM